MSKIIEDVLTTLGGSVEDIEYSKDVKMYVNSKIAKLKQNGCSALVDGFRIDEDTEWSDIFTCSSTITYLIINYIHDSVRYSFDPPSNGNVLKALKEELTELEWRIKNDPEYGDVDST